MTSCDVGEMDETGYSNISPTGYSFYEGDSGVESMSRIEALMNGGYTQQQAYEVLNDVPHFEDGDVSLSNDYEVRMQSLMENGYTRSQAHEIIGSGSDLPRAFNIGGSGDYDYTVEATTENEVVLSGNYDKNEGSCAAIANCFCLRLNNDDDDNSKS